MTDLKDIATDMEENTTPLPITTEALDQVHQSERWKSPILRAMLAILVVFHVLGNIDIIRARVIPAASEWENPLYAQEHSHVFYLVHWVTFSVFMYAAPLLLVKKFNQPVYMGAYFALWLCAGILTVVPLLGVQKTKQNFGVG